ncbi:MAG: hypothetical protein Kow00109_06930 [Acidobacteriota bacterium]
MRSENPLPVLLVRLGGGQTRFVGADPFIRKEPESAEGLFRRAKAAVAAAYHRMRNRFQPEENLCANLNLTRAVQLLHAPDLPCPAAQKLFLTFLRRRKKFHRKWLVIDGILALLGLLLTPIPGPNVFALYPAVRGFSHLQAYRGAAETLRHGVSSCSEEPLLARLEYGLRENHPPADVLLELESKYNLRGLEKLLEEP